MDTTRLAAKQKRYLDIERFVQEEATDPSIKEALLRTLQSYRSTLAKLWLEKDAPAPETAKVLESLERDLDTLHNRARLRS